MVVVPAREVVFTAVVAVFVPGMLPVVSNGWLGLNPERARTTAVESTPPLYATLGAYAPATPAMA